MNVSDATAQSTPPTGGRQAPGTPGETAEGLREVLHAQARFDEALSHLDAGDLRDASLLPGWTRAHVIAHVAYNARALARLVDWAATGSRNPMYESRAARDAEIEAGSQLTAAQLARLSAAEARSFEAAWSALPEDRWDYQVRDGRGSPLAVRDTLELRTRELWMHLIDLDAGVTPSDVPAVLQRRILQEVLDTWARHDHFVSAVATDDRSAFHPWASAECGPGVRDTDLRVSGTLSDLLAWATGRSLSGVAAADFQGRPLDTAPPAKPWI
ncbi:maleylpyruvate isomerase [Pseudoclavibacter sp. RFBJ3]|uniref:maleylpyruvate isomerase family mycothiol-dependent enzyme n=1 Tax=unclassified Pseudoclavibacter TaxID=2615177 RepID=UPI000CE92BBD|nr:MULTISPECIES: maleylpyruvate isomerase family mycothiol-dependent enzyme [unclassified Pseudoclavibacter]MBF4458434.1 maleylpyruvate isomerase family mycothiol-dependent enzyme [Pseudoclavibacter sp. VKM Ac-2867]PPF36563.1 maleylpyruvate isomerase [Pseudoclavibacter sp. AY1H1]PPF82557.1 maleylpyruvate isomerase [Pseudoclavibacter sp. RFBJ5]PPF91451.1 maleylpyruvate isomerase [Pseudoclavibacter sp. RFBJ3]PPF96375.1 maleylpyruvate isomerase [Pseudoclavibacter sp. RFBH5]